MIENTMQRFFSGLTSPEEEKTLFRQLGNSPEYLRQFILARKEYDRSLFNQTDETCDVDIDSEYEILKQRIENETHCSEKIRFQKRTTKYVRIGKQLIGYAAAIVFGFLLWQWIRPFPPTDPEKEITTSPISLTEITVPNGNRISVLLPDSSLVWINAGTQLKYPGHFSAQSREVWINGEACFEVTHDAERQFIVHTPTMDVKVYGTTFNINTYEDNCDQEITLIEGSVQLTASEPGTFESLFLVPGQQALYNQSGINIKKVDTTHAVAWKEGRFYFDNESFGSICKQLERSFNVEIKITGTHLKRSTFTGQFVNNESIGEILSVMASDRRISYSINGKEITICEK